MSLTHKLKDGNTSEVDPSRVGISGCCCARYHLNIDRKIEVFFNVAFESGKGWESGSFLYFLFCLLTSAVNVNVISCKAFTLKKIKNNKKCMIVLRSIIAFEVVDKWMSFDV
jgi:hypothetical protein